MPRVGALRLTTEFGLLAVAPGEIAVVQRGMRFAVALADGPARGYVLEVFSGHFVLPDLGPIGAHPDQFRTSWSSPLFQPLSVCACRGRQDVSRQKGSNVNMTSLDVTGLAAHNHVRLGTQSVHI